VLLVVFEVAHVETSGHQDVTPLVDHLGPGARVNASFHIFALRMLLLPKQFVTKTSILQAK